MKRWLKRAVRDRQTEVMAGHVLQNTLKPLRPFIGECDGARILSESRKAWHLILRSPHWNAIRKEIQSVTPSLQALSTDLSGDTITAELSPEAPCERLMEVCRALISWRVGPYQLGNFSLDTEWRSYLKWKRIAPLLPLSPGLRIADVGCSNGYFLFKLYPYKPEIAIGFDPIERCWLQFALLQSILRAPNTSFLPMGILSLDAFPHFFDLIVCMGVLYHQREQSLAVKHLFDATRPGGHVLVESLVVNQTNPLVITPPDRYAKMRNAWTIPSPTSLELLFKEAGFKEVCVHSFGPLLATEQRRTALAPFESLSDFLDPKDPSKTIEGHPAPHTAAVIGRK